MLCDCYLKNGKVYLPTMGQMDKGFYRDIEPVAVVSVADEEGLSRALRDTINRGNPTVRSLGPDAYPEPIVLKYAGAKNWSAFERGALTWSIRERNGIYRIVGQQLHRSGKGWQDDPEQTITFPPGTTTDDVIERMIVILQDAARTGSKKQ